MWNADSQLFTPAGSVPRLRRQYSSAAAAISARSAADSIIRSAALAWAPGTRLIVVGLMGGLQLRKPERHDAGRIWIALLRLRSKKPPPGLAAAGLVWPSGRIFFAYTNGGATGTRFGGTSFVSDVTGAPIGARSAAFWKTGWFLGGGTETSLSGRFLPVGLFLRSEYRYSYFSTTTVPSLAAGVTAFDDRLASGGADAQHVDRLQIQLAINVGGRWGQGKLGDNGPGRKSRAFFFGRRGRALSDRDGPSRSGCRLSPPAHAARG